MAYGGEGGGGRCVGVTGSLGWRPNCLRVQRRGGEEISFTSRAGRSSLVRRFVAGRTSARARAHSSCSLDDASKTGNRAEDDSFLRGERLTAFPGPVLADEHR